MGEKEMYRIMPAGDRGLVVEFGNVIDIQTNDRVQQLKKCLREASDTRSFRVAANLPLSDDLL